MKWFLKVSVGGYKISCREKREKEVLVGKSVVCMCVKLEDGERKGLYRRGLEPKGVV